MGPRTEDAVREDARDDALQIGDTVKYEPKSQDKFDTKAHEAKESKREEKAEHVKPKAKPRTDMHPGLRYR